MKTLFSRGYSWVEHNPLNYQLLGGYEVVRENMKSFTANVGLWTFDFTLNEGGNYTINDKSKIWVRSANLGRLYPPGTKIEYKINSIKTPIKTLYICFKILNGVSINQFDWKQFDHYRFHDTDQLLQKELQNIVDSRDYFYKAQGSFCNILNLLFNCRNLSKNEFKIEKGSILKNSAFSDKVKKVLMDNVEKKLTLDMVSNILNISKSKLSHRYRLENGESPMMSHSKFKIEKAKIYLLNGESNKVIADALGYSDEYHFSKNFKIITGKSPRDYKRDF